MCVWVYLFGGFLAHEEVQLVGRDVLTGDILMGVLDGNVQVAVVDAVGLAGQAALDDVSGGGNQIVLQIEHSLLPVGVTISRTSGEEDRLVAGREGDVKVAEEGMDVVRTGHLKLELGIKGQVFLGDRLDVDLLEDARSRAHRLTLDNINERLMDGNLFDGLHVEPVNIVPEVDLLLLILGILDTNQEHGGFVREDQALRSQVAITSVQDGVQHGLIQQKVAHPLTDDDVNRVNRQLHLLHLTLQQDNLYTRDS